MKQVLFDNDVLLEIIVTRNTNDFLNSLVPALRPDEFLKVLSQ